MSETHPKSSEPSSTPAQLTFGSSPKAAKAAALSKNLWNRTSAMILKTAKVSKATALPVWCNLAQEVLRASSHRMISG